MTRPKFKEAGADARLRRIERKCDRILAVLGGTDRQEEIDTIVARLHLTARAMASESRRERARLEGLFGQD